ncbi:Minf_1886 family protein [Planctomicrobium piriforme]|uniref:Verruc_Plancto-restricted protein n=1 Tax=Planctomicrobium piriforme TaxID=1576369 RepID=A0A1I3BFS4_9PLAN|nr:Minf_1886 family protein [Planctomicrobium piriforme]SFH61155.1 Verruc_Plancto-restricted protein [Planctomicrobium piriforme]
MSATGQSTLPRFRFHNDAYRFVFEALHHTQQRLKRPIVHDVDDDRAHITGPELLHGVKDLALERYGLLAKNVFSHWGVKSTGDFGRIVFELIERGEMRKTDRDQLTDFYDVYDFEDALDRDYKINVSKVG